MNYNPFAPEVQANPYPYYAELRDQAPVAWVESMQGWAVSRYADVDFALRNPGLFSSAVWNAAASGDLVVVPEAPGLLSMDPPDHTRMLEQVPRIANYLIRGPQTLPVRFETTRRAVA